MAQDSGDTEDSGDPTTDGSGALDPTLVGAALRDARVAAGWSMGELARRSGVSQPYISQVEHGKFSPSLTTLYRLAGALGVPTSSLVPPMESDTEEGVHRHGRGTAVTMGDAPDSPIGHMLSRGGASHLEAFVYELDPGSVEHGAEFAHGGEEFQYVLSGRLEITLDGGPPIELGEGDSLHFDARRAHAWHVPGPERARVLLVVSYPQT
jgi:transcriptional regulator with XRE-family HTH domain